MKNETFDSVAEDVLGWWAKAGWQDGLGDKLGLRDVLEDGHATPDAEDMMASSSLDFEEEVDLVAMSSTSVSIKPAEPAEPKTTESPLSVPPILAHVQPNPTETLQQSLIRRVDTPALLLSVSLRLAKLPSTSEAAATGSTASAFAHQAKIAHANMIQKQSRVTEVDSLVAENVTIESRVNIKESVIGVGCTIGSGSRLTRCLLMEGAVVGENVTLTGCILGRRCKIEGGGPKDEDKTRLTDCEVQGGFVVEWGSKLHVHVP